MIYHETEHGILYCGDCLDILPTLADKSVDLVLTDPPYGIGASNKSFRSGKGWADYGDETWDNITPDKSVWLEILRTSLNQIVWGGNYFSDMLPTSMGWLVWNKMQRDFSLADGELAWTSFNRALRIYDYSRGAALQDGKVHPTQKPVSLFEWCLNMSTEQGNLILDPFAGSGTTAIACIRLNRKYILIEKEEKYCEIAAKRIETELEQTDLFREES